MSTTLPRDQVTGLVLAGGRGSRMGGVDKGLQPLQGVPLARLALERLAPQVGPLLLNANRHLDAYAAFGVPLCSDEPPDFAGPLAGFLAGLVRCTTPWLVAVPCDTPRFPQDLVARLVAAAHADAADIALPATIEGGAVRRQPAFCLMRAALRDDLDTFVRGGGRKIEHWIARHRAVDVRFDDAAAFFNANTLDDLQTLERR